MNNDSKIIKEPYMKKGYIWYEANFQSLSQLQLFLKKNPKINTKVFSSQSSKSNDCQFHGEPLKKAIEYLLSNYNEDYEKFLSLKNEITNALDIKVPRRKYIKSQVGSRVHMANFVANKPKYMLRLEPQKTAKFITIYFNSAYPCYNSEEQIKTRGILTLNLIKILEMNHYHVNLNTFSIAKENKEMVYIKINLKNPEEILDEKKCYFPFCAREFERRCIFRVQESLAVKEDGWGYGYGECLDTKEIKELLDLKEKDIIISNPTELGISGYNIYQDTDNFFSKIHLDESIKVKKLSK